MKYTYCIKYDSYEYAYKYYDFLANLCIPILNKEHYGLSLSSHFYDNKQRYIIYVTTVLDEYCDLFESLMPHGVVKEIWNKE